eukprot:8210210-Pyramimonas_sp.AAC.1
MVPNPNSVGRHASRPSRREPFFAHVREKPGFAGCNPGEGCKNGAILNNRMGTKLGQGLHGLSPNPLLLATSPLKSAEVYPSDVGLGASVMNVRAATLE